MKPVATLRALLVSGLLIGFAVPTAAQSVDSTKLEAMAPRAIAPAGMSGRVTAIEAVASHPDIVYAGTALQRPSSRSASDSEV
jgi:hypothetical protein